MFWIPEGSGSNSKGMPCLPFALYPLTNLQKMYSAGLTDNTLHEPETEAGAGVSSPVGPMGLY